MRSRLAKRVRVEFGIRGWYKKKYNDLMTKEKAFLEEYVNSDDDVRPLFALKRKSTKKKVLNRLWASICVCSNYWGGKKPLIELSSTMRGLRVKKKAKKKTRSTFSKNQKKISLKIWNKFIETRKMEHWKR